MDVQTLTMPRHEARERLRAYRKSLHRRADAEYDIAAKGLEAIAEGFAVIDVAAAIRETAIDHVGRPMLAIARSDRKHVVFEHDSWSPTANFWTESTFTPRQAVRDHYPTLVRDVHMGMTGRARAETVPGRGRDDGVPNGYSLVPMVPPQALEEAGRPQLKKCFTLWEVEHWADTKIASKSDLDPYLLKHIGGDLYAVLAAWELTELERAVMNGRRMS